MASEQHLFSDLSLGEALESSFDALEQEAIASSQQPPASSAPPALSAQQTPRPASLEPPKSSLQQPPLSQPTPATSFQQPATPLPSVKQDVRPVEPREYVFPWGKHKDKTLADIPLDYLRWLKSSSDAYKSNATMQTAVDQHLIDVALNGSVPPSSMPASSQTTRTPLAEKSTNPTVQDGPYVLPWEKHQGKTLEEAPADYVEWLKKGDSIKTDTELAAAVAEWDKVERVYVLGFGKWKGYTLDQVPPQYLSYLEETNADKDHDDLRRGLAAHKQANAVAQMNLAKNAKGRKKKPFSPPSETTTDYRRYHYDGDRRRGQMWIGCNDALRYFGADARAMVEAGLPRFNKGQRFWVHQVFAYEQYFKTTKSETPTAALNRFKARKYSG